MNDNANLPTPGKTPARAPAAVFTLPSTPGGIDIRPPQPPVAPGYKSSEFWLTAAGMLLGAILPVAHAGPLTLGTAAPVVIGPLASIFAAIAYARNRTQLKAAAAS